MSASSKRDMHTSSEKEAVRWVELLLELAVSEECLVEAASHLCQRHYQDVVEERNIEGWCGYPCCGQWLGVVPRQKYHVSVERKLVLDLTERKKFCSAQCYKASNFFYRQLSTVLSWSRAHRQELIKLLPLTAMDSACHPSHLQPSHSHPTLSHCTSSQLEELGHIQQPLTPPLEQPSPSTPSLEQPSPSTTPPLEQPSPSTTPPLEQPSPSTTPPLEQSSPSTSLEQHSPSTTPPLQQSSPSTPPLEQPSPSTTPPLKGVEQGMESLELVEERVQLLQFPKLSPVGKILHALNSWCTPTTWGLLQSGPEGIHDQVRVDPAQNTVYLPPVHSMSQNQLQRNIFWQQARKSLPAVAGELGLSVTEVQSSLGALLKTFKLDRHTVTFRPAEWRLLLLVLLQRLYPNCTSQVATAWLTAVGASLDDLALMRATLQPPQQQQQRRL